MVSNRTRFPFLAKTGYDSYHDDKGYDHGYDDASESAPSVKVIEFVPAQIVLDGRPDLKSAIGDGPA